ncbi:aminotransferase class I/II-fold pyridoxal phosphate-dependent enzyme [Carboxydothermus hydrogenoformans]|uniref:Lysine decarboxylase n=1 Tax=Carboxydothermus hydrogenoformans (strain ATCC BAA-161 / DSM 6008 / Z-2901) TaxID=246194 RepID=Q3AG13_CARHZ|nr:lysine decarboxylase [Carboxydothermus hydrogenoformans]ABB16189.1 lysine decarboxylase [Carboxydothermus hydrogenoformans Z-2901]
MSGLIDKIQKHIQKKPISFHMPGHKNGRFIPKKVKNLLGEKYFKADLTELPGLDNLYAPEEAILKLEEKLSRYFGLPRAHLSVNGSTAAVIALLLSFFRPGEKIAIDRMSHVSLYHGMVLGDLIPEFIYPHWDEEYGLPVNKTPKAHNKSYFLTNPDYQGLIRDLTELKTDRLLLDAAHGGLIPLWRPDFFKNIAGFAVSLHKTGPFPNPLAAVVFRDKGIEVKRALNLIQTTSPSYPLMAAAEGGVDMLLKVGARAFQKAKELSDHFKEYLKKRGIGFLQDKYPADPLKVTIKAADLGVSGEKIAAKLMKKGIYPEAYGPGYVLFMFSPGNTEKDVKKLINIIETIKGTDKKIFIPKNPFSFQPELKLTPREVYYAQEKLVDLKASVGYTARDGVTVYPPGAPVLYPGEEITKEAVEYLEYHLNLGVKVTGIYDGRIKVVR